MAEKKKKYEPPIAYDISGAVSGDAHAQVKCQSGSNPGGTTKCQAGGMASALCSVGNIAGGKCQNGNAASGGKCQTGGVPAY